MTQSSNLTTYLRKVTSQGLEIKHVYDIGACVGRWMQQMKAGVLFNSKFYLFEANPAYKEILSSYNTFVHMGVLSNPGRETVEFYNGTDTGDSYYKETTSHYEKRTPIVLPCKTLDEVIRENNLPIPNLLKIDTQGSELDILEGSESILSEVDLIYLECPIIQYNQGAPSIGEYLKYLKSKRFVPTDVLEIHRSEEVLLQVDIMFINEKTRNKLYGNNVHIKPFA